ncbi:MAG: hypothetical protein NTV00_07705 [Methylococcales bacterium]|nr:hypothetical protein [Methylococcales bacterium]
MLALRKFETVGSNGKVQIDIPQEFGSRVEILILPVHDNVDSSDTSVDTYFLSNAFEDDSEEDAIWQKYITEKKI